MATASFISLFNTNMTLGQEYRFKITSYDSSYLHKLVIKCGSYSMTFNRVKGGVETTFTVPLTWGNAMPNSTSLNGTLTLTTYQSNYSTKVGSNDVETTKFNIPSSMVPSVDLDVTEATSGITDKFGFYIQSKSKLKVNVIAAGAYGSTIKSYKTTIEGVSYTASSFTSNALTKSGSVTISTTVTDSRGKTKSTFEIFPVTAYTSPTIYAFLCNRANSKGEADDNGTYLNANINFSISELKSINDNSYSLHYRLKDSDEWVSIASGNVYSFDDSILSTSAILDVNSSYEIRLTIKDYFTTRYAYFDMGTAFTLINYNSSGRAIAFGGVSEKEEGVEFKMKAYFKNAESPNGALDIPNSTDLNNVMDEGFYCIPTSSVAGSISNKPYEGTATGLLIVLRAGNEGQRAQIYLRCTKDVSELYIRWYYQSDWGAWVSIGS